MSFLKDLQFLDKLNQYAIRKYYAKIDLLDFVTEKKVAEVTGQIIDGSITISSSSLLRRVGALKIALPSSVSQGVPVDELIKENKKIAFSVGINNPFKNEYGEILWFPQGIFVITSASINIGTEMVVNIQIGDKMTKLNGLAGGVLPASVSFHSRTEIDDFGNIITTFPTIREIIFELVHHFGEEDPSKIIIEDVPEVGRVIVKYNGDTPINFSEEPTFPYERLGISFVIGDPPVANFPATYFKGDILGYKETELTYPGELIFQAGRTVSDVLTQIKDTLGGFEFFYDIEGNFIFRKITSYYKTGNVPLNITDTEDGEFQRTYFPRPSYSGYKDIFKDNKLVKDLTPSPNIAAIKNDFLYWGGTEEKGIVRYRLSIDDRPRAIWPIGTAPIGETEASYTYPEGYSLCFKNIYEVLEKVEGSEKKPRVVRYQVEDLLVNDDEVLGRLVAPDLREALGLGNHFLAYNWREELYRKALLSYGTSTRGSHYDEELLAEWRLIFDPTSEDFRKAWVNHFGRGENSPPWLGYTINTVTNTERIRYWIDLIDSVPALSRFSVKEIGRRTQTTTDSKASQVFLKEVNDVVFIENTGEKDIQEKIAYYLSIGQGYSLVTKDLMPLFQPVPLTITCYEGVREELYTRCLIRNSVSFNTIPVFYLDVNTMITLPKMKTGSYSDFLIDSISWRIPEGTMSITANEAVVVF